MAKRFIILLILLIAICYATKVSSQEIRLNLDDIKDLLRRGVSSEMILELIKEQGVNFKATDRDLLELRRIGADETVSGAVMEASKEWIILTIETEPTDAVIYVDGERKGKTPFALEGPKSREYNIKIEKEGYMPVERKISLVDIDKTKIYLQKAPPVSIWNPIIEFEYNYSERQISADDNIKTLEKNQIGVSKLHYWANNRFDIFFDIGYVKAALSESEKFGDVSLLFGGGLKWVIFSSSSLDLDLKGEFLSFNDKQEGIGTYKREIAWSEYDGSTTLTSMAFQHIRPYFSVLLSKINSKVKYMNNLNQKIADFDFNESDPFGVAVGTKIVAGRFSLDGKIIATDINNSNSNKKSSLGYSIGMAFSF